MKKLLLLGALAVAGLAAQAESYNLVQLSYDNTQLWYGSNFNEKEGLEGLGHDKNSTSFNGFGLQYLHGFGLGEKPMNIEVGLKWNMLWNGKTYVDGDNSGNYWYTDQYQFRNQLMRLAIPVNYIYHFNIKDNFAIAPYVGLDFRFNVLAKTKLTGTYTNSDGDYEKDEYKVDWLKKYKDGNDGVDDFYKWNVFQMGWHVGVRFECCSKITLGIEYGTDFIPLMSHKEYGEKHHINTGNLAISLGYKF